MYINFALNLYMTLSSADNPFKQFGPRSDPLCQVEVESMYFNFGLNLYRTLSSADNPFKQIGPRSGSTFCPGLIGIQTVWHFRGYEKIWTDVF